MPKIARKGMTVYAYDVETEVLKPLAEGYFTEAYARMDAMLDAAIDAALGRAYPNACCAKLLKDLEKAMRKEYAAVSGLVKARVLMENGSIPKQLYARITAFKGARNRMVHDIEAPDALSDEEKKAKIAEGVECFRELLR